MVLISRLSACCTLATRFGCAMHTTPSRALRCRRPPPPRIVQRGGTARTWAGCVEARLARVATSEWRRTVSDAESAAKSSSTRRWTTRVVGRGTCGTPPAAALDMHTPVDVCAAACHARCTAAVSPRPAAAMAALRPDSPPVRVHARACVTTDAGAQLVSIPRCMRLSCPFRPCVCFTRRKVWRRQLWSQAGERSDR